MIVKGPKGKEIEIEDVHGPYDDDIQFSAYYVDSGDEVSDDVLDYIGDTYFEQIYQEWYEGKIEQAEYLMDMDR